MTREVYMTGDIHSPLIRDAETHEELTYKKLYMHRLPHEIGADGREWWRVVPSPIDDISERLSPMAGITLGQMASEFMKHKPDQGNDDV